MEVVKPELYWVQDRCYRRNPCKNDYTKLRNSGSGGTGSSATADGRGFDQESQKVSYEELDDHMDDLTHEDEDNAKYVVENTENGFKSKVTNIPSSFYPLIIGAKGSTKKRLESETNTKIIIPRINEKGDIVVRGQRRRDVLSARRRLDLMVSQARAKRDVTHYACFPLNTDQVMDKFNEFKDKVLRAFGSRSRGLDESIFQTPEKLHVTICVMILLDAKERDEVSKAVTDLNYNINLLHRFKSVIRGDKLFIGMQHAYYLQTAFVVCRNLIGNKTHRMHLRGLEIMNDDPSEVDVLYAKCILDDEVLQNVADFVSNELEATGYCKPSRGENVKLHATVMNTRYRSDVAAGTEDANDDRYKGYGSGRNKRESFDARQIMEKFGNFDFGTVEINEIKVVTRHSKGGLTKDVAQSIQFMSPYTPLFQK